jgi:hypothetical protein
MVVDAAAGPSQDPTRGRIPDLEEIAGTTSCAPEMVNEARVEQSTRASL